jgi:hypothetical protein
MTDAELDTKFNELTSEVVTSFWVLIIINIIVFFTLLYYIK